MFFPSSPMKSFQSENEMCQCEITDIHQQSVSQIPDSSIRLVSIFSTASLLNLFFFPVLFPDPLRSGQGRWNPLQHHGSGRRPAAQRDLQHRPHQRQHVRHPTPGQRGEGFLPRKKLFISVSPRPGNPWKGKTPSFPLPPPTSTFSFFPLTSFAEQALGWSSFRGRVVLYATFSAASPGRHRRRSQR